MAKYEIRDNITGRTVVVEGNHAPTEQEAEQIFNEAGLRTVNTSVDSQPEMQDQTDDRFLGGALPIAGGILGGATGAIGGLGVGSVPLGVAGAGIGAGGGYVLEDLLGDYFGAQEQDPMQNLQQAGSEVLQSSGGQLFGTGVARGAGLVTHPIKPLINYIDDLLARSKKTIDVSKALTRLREEGLKGEKGLIAKGVGNEATKAFKKLSGDLSSALSELVPDQIIPTKVPISTANIHRRAVDEGVKYGERGTPLNQLTKDYTRFLRNDIREAAPAGVNIANKAVEGISKVPEILGDLIGVIPGGKKAASLPFKALGKTFPYGGGVWNQILPALFQMGNRQ